MATQNFISQSFEQSFTETSDPYDTQGLLLRLPVLSDSHVSEMLCLCCSKPFTFVCLFVFFQENELFPGVQFPLEGYRF